MANVEVTGGLFYPLVVELYGTWSPNSLQILKTIARRPPLPSGVSVSRAVVDLHGWLSLSLWQYNARMVLDCSSLLGLDGDSLFSSCDW